MSRRRYLVADADILARGARGAPASPTRFCVLAEVRCVALDLLLRVRMRRFLNVTLVAAMFVSGACNVETAPAAPAEKPAEASAPNAPNERLVPTLADGALIGFKVFAMKPESIYARSGFQAGDLIVAIDGEKITKAEDVAKIDAGLANSGVVQLTVSRKGFKLPRPIELKK
jgi:membrane-associated protease RseP (regulator of RpoE activity)